MTDEKPKHKPQKKHTLNEVLKSLQDLIRNDLGGTRAAAKTVRQAQKRPGETTSFAAATRLTGTGATPTGGEADSFNQALEKLDEIIHQKIIEPVERIRQAPPEPLALEEDLQIDWEDTAEPQAADPGEVQFDLGDDAKLDDIHFETAQPASSDTAARGDVEIEFEAFTPAVEEPAEPAAENTDIDALGPAEAGAIEDVELTPLDFVENPSKETIEPAHESHEPKAADDQSVFSFNESAFESEPVLPDRDSLAAQAEAEPRAPALKNMKTEPTLSFDTALRPHVSRRSQGPEADKGPATFTVEYRPEPRPTATDATAETKRESQPAAAAPPGNVQKRAPPPEPVEPAAPSRAAPQYEIPVLKDVAELDVSRPVSPPLPAAGQAREIAIRVIARLNIERRKAGEPPLDIKTIEQLQQYLAEALVKRALNQPK